MFGYALVARAMRYEMKILLALDSALVAKRQVFERLDRITQCLAAGVQLEVCQASAQTFNIRPEDLIPGVKITGIATFFAYAEDAVINFSWS